MLILIHLSLAGVSDSTVLPDFQSNLPNKSDENKDGDATQSENTQSRTSLNHYSSTRAVNLEPLLGDVMQTNSYFLSEEPLLSTSEPTESSSQNPGQELNQEELVLSSILLKLTTADRDSLLRLKWPSAVRWKNNAEFQQHLDGDNLQVCFLLRLRTNRLCSLQIFEPHS